MAHEIALYKKLKESETGTTLSRKQVASLYQTQGRTARDSEPVTENYVNTALNVYDKICSQPALARCTGRLEVRFGISSCLNNMTSLAAIITRTDDQVLRKWVMEGLCDAVLSGLLTNDDVTKTVLAGSGTVTSLCTLLQFRRQVLNRYLQVDLPKLGVHYDDLERFRDMLADHEMYRKHVRGANQSVDTTWKARCRPSSLLALDLLEDCPTQKRAWQTNREPAILAGTWLLPMHKFEALGSHVVIVCPCAATFCCRHCNLGCGLHGCPGQRPQVCHQEQG